MAYWYEIVFVATSQGDWGKGGEIDRVAGTHMLAIEAISGTIEGT